MSYARSERLGTAANVGLLLVALVGLLPALIAVVPHATHDHVVVVVALVMMAVGQPLAVHALLDTWGDHHTGVRLALMVFAGLLPLVTGVAALLSVT